MLLQKNLVVAVVRSLMILVGIWGAAKKSTEFARPQSSYSANLAPTPPMGWNSYDSYCGDVTEEEMKRNADYMAKYLARLGWKYVVVDFYWYYPHPVTDGHHEGDLEVAMDD